MEGGRQTVSSASNAAWDTSSVVPLLLARGLRDFGDGFAAVLLPAYLLAIGLSPWQVGVLSSVSLLGSSLLTLTVGVLGARLEYRWLLLRSLPDGGHRDPVFGCGNLCSLVAGFVCRDNQSQ